MLAYGILLALAASVQATRVSTPELQLKLRTAPNVRTRIELLDKDDDFVFDFLNPPGGSGETIGKGGHTVGASGANFPALIGSGMAMTVGFLGPCGYNTPHTHPRATEFNIVVSGKALRAGIIHENGGRFIINDVPLGSAAIFQQGAIHFEQNLGCEPAIFVAGFNNEDPGVTQIADRFLGDVDPDFVKAAIGAYDIKEFKDLVIPANVALGTDECLARCKIDRKTFTYNGTAAYTWGAVNALVDTHDNGKDSGKKTAAGSIDSSIRITGGVAEGDASGSGDIPFDRNPLRTTVIALGAVAAALLLALIAAVIRIFTAPKRVVYDSLDAGKRPLILSDDNDRSSTAKSHSRSASYQGDSHTQAYQDGGQ